jgi:hypothetical protein
MAVQELHYSWFDFLRENDVLFVDSTCCQKGEYVAYLYPEVLSRLNSDILVYAHDMFLLLEYLRN